MPTAPHSRELLRSLGPLKLLNLTKIDGGWIVEAEGHKSAVCPSCQTLSRSRHSRYGRSLRDLPLQGASVTLKLQFSRWRCREPSCAGKIFVERLPELLQLERYQAHVERSAEREAINQGRFSC